MMDLREKYRTSVRRGSALRIEANPLEVPDKIIDEDNNDGISIPSKVELKIENLSDAKPIEPEIFKNLFCTLQKLRYCRLNLCSDMLLKLTIFAY